MINDKVTSQEGGDNSTNVQGKTIFINNGLTYQDAKEIALDVFKSNFLELSEKAAKTARERAEELVDDFIIEMQNRNPSAITSMEDPSMQYAIFTAQKEYARTGDKDLSDILVDILVDRAAQQERNLKQIVLDESLSIVPKLTSSQLDTLTIIFILKYSKTLNLSNLDSFNDYLKKYISPFTSKLSKEDSLYQHLEFTSCGSITTYSKNIEEIFLLLYPGLFSKGFTREQFETSGHKIEEFPTLIMPCFNDSNKFQVAALNHSILEEKVELVTNGKSIHFMFKVFIDSYLMNTLEVNELITDQLDFMKSFCDIWNNSFINNMSLTSVGISIAIANLRRKIGATVDLGVWIK